MYEILWLCLSPLLGSLLVPLKKRNRLYYYLAIFFIPISNIAVLQLTHPKEIIRLGLVAFAIDTYSHTFLMVLNVCWALTIIYASDYIRYQFQKKALLFHQVFAAVIALITATGLACNFFTIFIFYLLSIPLIYPLIVMRQTPESYKAGKLYLISTLGPGIVILFPTLLFINEWVTPFYNLEMKSIFKNDTVASLVLGGLILGFSRNCVAPFFAWLPRSAVAPGPVTALIHSVGAVHTGTITVLKIAVYSYGMQYLKDLSDNFWQSGWLIYLCGFTAIFTAYKAYKATNLKYRFSYSTVGQLSYIITAILIGTPGSIKGAMLHIVTHSIAKINLFFVIGLFNSLYGTVMAQDIAKIIPKHKGLALAIAISGLSIAGFPFLAGYYSKDLMLIEELHRFHYAAAIFLGAGSIINFVYIYPVIKAAVTGKSDPNFTPKKLPKAMALAISLTMLCIFALSVNNF